MTKLNTGQTTQVRARRLLESLLDYVNPLADSKKLDNKLQSYDRFTCVNHCYNTDRNW